jgi:hypothetical protein
LVVAHASAVPRDVVINGGGIDDNYVEVTKTMTKVMRKLMMEMTKILKM